MNYKEISGIIAAALSIAAYAPYIWNIIKGKNRPHVFSWLIWTIATLMVGLATLSRGGAGGAWVMIFTSGLCIITLALSYLKSGDVTIYKSDWVFLTMALVAMPIWYFTKEPLYAVLIMTFIDLMAYLPTLRKISDNPFSEDMTMYFITIVRNIFIIIATENYNYTTLSFHLITGFATFATLIYTLSKRSKLAKTN